MHETSVTKGDDYTPEMDIVFSTKGDAFEGGQWGFAFSASHQVRNNREKSTNEITWLPSINEFGEDDRAANQLSEDVVITSNENQRADGAYFYPESLYYRYNDIERTRDNAQVTFQMVWHCESNFRLYIFSY